jgi:nitrile hydratase
VSDHHDDHEHDHDDQHGHSHYDSPRSRRHRSPFELRTMALEAALVEKGLLATDAVDAFLEGIEHTMGPHNGARVVARAWVDAAFKARLLTDGSAAVAEMGLVGPEGDTIRVVENTDAVHNMVVCTLCSCYPWPLLGLPPIWYKSFAYRSRAVAEPRAVLREFGLELGPSVEVRVWDSSAEVRYLVLPQRPAGTDALGEDELAALVGRDSMIGTALAGVRQG